MKQPSIGRIVHFCYGAKHVPAIVTRVNDAAGTIECYVFPPGVTPFQANADYAADAEPATWHWPEFVPEGVQS